MSREPSGNLHSGILAGAAGNGSLNTLYTAGKRGAENLALYISNQAASAKTYRVQVISTPNSVTRYLAYDVSIGANSYPHIIDIPSLRMSDVVKFLGSDSNVEAVLIGDTYE